MSTDRDTNWYILQLRSQIEKASEKGKLDELKGDLAQWKEELERFQRLLPLEAQYSAIREKELPGLEKQLKEEKDRLPNYVSHYELVGFAKHTVLCSNTYEYRFLKNFSKATRS